MKNTTQYIKAGWMIDGSGAPVRKNALLAVKNNIITNISQFREDDCPAPALLTDLSRCTILPPLVDCHVHLAMSASTDSQVREKQLTAAYEECRPRMAEHMHALFSSGVLAVRDGGDHHGHVQRYKNETEGKGGKKQPLIKSGGPGWHQSGRYGAFMGGYPKRGETLETAVSHKIDSVDHIKVINSGLNSLIEFGKESEAQFSREELEDLVQLADKKGKKVMVHANGREPVRRALDAGCHSIEHGFFMGEENLKQMAEQGTVWVPTAVTMKAQLESWNATAHGQGKKRVIELNLDHQLQQMARAKQYGVQLALGTDAGCSGVLHGQSVLEELQLFITAGYSLVEAIQCASSNGAKLLDLHDMGRIARGLPAHFIVARATPAMLPQRLSQLEAIYLDGSPCHKLLFTTI